MQFRNARVAHEASPALLLLFLPPPSSPSRVLSSLQEETRAEGGDEATRKELAGIPREDFFFHFCTLEFYLFPLSSFVRRTLCSRVFLPPVGNYFPSIHLYIQLYIRAALITKRKSRRRIKITSLCCKRVMGCIPIRSKVRILHFQVAIQTRAQRIGFNLMISIEKVITSIFLNFLHNRRA